MAKRPYCGIYLILNKKTRQAYVGQSTDCHRRMNEHRSRNKSEIDQALTEHLKDFDFYYIKRCKPSQLDMWEDYYIYKYDAYENGYNQKVGRYYSYFKEKFQEK